MSQDTLALIWFILLGVLLVGYAILDGFDFGVGILHPLAKTDEERRIVLNSIGPLWDGNEVWLVTFGGALFAAFPNAYATVFSSFYVAFKLLLFALIFRAVSIEFRSKVNSAGWKRVWDAGFFLSSLTAALLLGVAAGNVMQGMEIDHKLVYHGSILSQLTLYPLLVGVQTVAMFTMHGSIFLYLKTEGALQQRVYQWMWKTFGFYLVMYLIVTMYTLVKLPWAHKNIETNPWLAIFPLLNILALANIPRALFKHRPVYAFASSCAVIAAQAALFAVAIFPNFVISNLDPEFNVTIFNAASSPKTLTIMLIIACIGLPFVLTYSAIILWVFRGKVKLDRQSY